MNQDQNPKGDFEDRLLVELRAIVAGREPAGDEAEAVNLTPGWRRGPRLALAGGAVTAVAAAALVVGAGGGDTPAAYAVTPRGDGDLSVEIRSLGDPEGLRSALAAAGVPAEVDYEPGVAECEAASSQGIEVTEAVPTVPAEAAHLTIDPGEVGPGETLVLTAVPAGEGIEVETTVAEVEPRSTEARPRPTRGRATRTEPAETAEEDACGESTEGSAAAPSISPVPARHRFRRGRSR